MDALYKVDCTIDMCRAESQYLLKKAESTQNQRLIRLTKQILDLWTMLSSKAAAHAQRSH